jgi:hypothetical protein
MRLMVIAAAMTALTTSTGVWAQDMEYISNCFPRWADVGSAIGGYVFLTDREGLYIIDISVPLNPSLIGVSDSAGGICRVFGNYAYVAKGQCDEEYQESYLRIIDWTDPTQPALISSYTPLECPSGISRVGDYLLLSEYDPFFLDGEFEIITAADPFHPRQLTSRSIGSFPTCIGANSDFAVVGAGYEEPYIGEVQIYDIQDIASPVLRGICEIPEWPHSIFIDSYYAFVADGFSGLEIIDFSNAQDPVIIGCYDTQGIAYDVAIMDNYAVIADDTAGIQILNIENPYLPIYVQSYSIPEHTLDVYVKEDYIFASNSDSVIILRFIPPSGIITNTCPGDAFLSMSYPNPFNAATSISYNLPAASDVSLDIYDILGRKVGTLASGHQEAGPHHVVWNAGDTPSGVYFYRLKAGERTETNRMLLLK